MRNSKWGVCVRILLTGFGPFRQWSVNSSEQAVRALTGKPGLVTRVLPVDHLAAPVALVEAMADGAPDAVLCTGLSPAPMPKLERRARRPATVAAGEAVHAGVWPWAAALDAMAAAGARAGVSDDAGAYVCETVYWHALAARLLRRPAPPTTFLHLPPVSDAWPVDRLAAAVEACLSVVGAPRGAARGSA